MRDNDLLSLTDYRMIRKSNLLHRLGQVLLIGSDFMIILVLGFTLISHFDWLEGLTASGNSVTIVVIGLLSIAWVFFFWIYDSYSRYYWPSGLDFFFRPLRAVLPAMGFTAIVMLIINVQMHRRFFLVWLVSFVVLMLVARILFRTLIRRGYGTGKVVLYTLLVLDGVDDLRSFDKLLDGAGGAFRFVGAIGGDPALAEKVGLPHLGGVEELVSHEDTVLRDCVLLCSGEISPETLDRLAWLSRDVSAHLTVVVDPLIVSAPRLQLRTAFGVIVGEASIPGLSRVERFWKRVFDIIVSSVALLVFSPVLIIVAIAVFIEDRGSVLFSQERVGIDMKPFKIFKFRSMFVGADKLEKELRKSLHREGEMWKVDRDPRITRVGRFIRATSLDELPQLFNVLKGDMSIVGPRPKQAWEVDAYSPAQQRRFSLLPGITGLSQVSGRSDLRMDEAVELDLEYARNWSLGRDVIICLATAYQLLIRRGAY